MLSDSKNTLPTWAVRQVENCPQIFLEGFKMFRILDGSGFEGMGCEYVVLEPGKVLEPHIHEKSHSIILVIKGEGFAFVDGRRYVLKENSVINVPPGIKHGLEAGNVELVVYGFQHPGIINDQNDADIYFVEDGRKGLVG